MSAKILTLNWGEMLPSRMPLSLRPLLIQLSRLEFGSVKIQYKNDLWVHVKGREEGPVAELNVKNPLRLMQRIFWRGDLGFAEGYMAGEWDSPDLTKLLYVFSLNLDALSESCERHPLLNQVIKLQHQRNRNTVKGSRRNIAAHYDLGNEFYQRWLDSSMTYSSAVYDQSSELEAAQQRKYDLILNQIDPKPGDHILEIGCGWGGFAEYAARWGVKVTGITLSKEQLAFAQARIERSGVAQQVELKLCDYRELDGQYDHVVSIEMFEAVGQEYWREYFDVIGRCLKPGGRASLQVITIREDQFEEYANNPGGFIQQYIFPGGMLPTKAHLRNLAFDAMLAPEEMRSFGIDYADTLENWQINFNSEVRWMEDHGYDERFRRMWRYYLAFCEAGFRGGRIDVVHFLMEKS